MAAGGKLDNKRKNKQTKGHYVCGVIGCFYKPL